MLLFIVMSVRQRSAIWGTPSFENHRNTRHIKNSRSNPETIDKFKEVKTITPTSNTFHKTKKPAFNKVKLDKGVVLEYSTAINSTASFGEDAEIQQKNRLTKTDEYIEPLVMPDYVLHSPPDVEFCGYWKDIEVPPTVNQCTVNVSTLTPTRFYLTHSLETPEILQWMTNKWAKKI